MPPVFNSDTNNTLPGLVLLILVITIPLAFLASIGILSLYRRAVLRTMRNRANSEMPEPASTGSFSSHQEPVSLGTGRFKKRKQPRWIGAWLEWVLASPGEQQTEITQRHFSQMIFYRIDTELQENIGLDDPRKIPRILEYGEKLAEMIGWEAILAGTETRFRVGTANTLWEQYKV